MILYKYHGAGNDFLIGDDRHGDFHLSAGEIAQLCERRTGLGADGLMLLQRSAVADFKMLYFNADGSGGMMCGNGGRCIVAFAADMGYDRFHFEAPDGMHEAQLVAVQGREKAVRLKMKEVPDYGRASQDEYFLDTGTRHLVRFVDGLDQYDVVGEGRKVRYDERYAPVGTNVNFVERIPVPSADYDSAFRIRTYEKGVEDETLACGTGIVASALSVHARLGDPLRADSEVVYAVEARINSLQVEFRSRCVDGLYSASQVWLTGPATYVARMEVNL